MKLGIATTDEITKNQNQPVDSATKPPPDDNVVRPTAASAVSNANCVAVCARTPHSADR